MQFIDLAAQQHRIREEVEQRIRTVLDHGRYIMGPEVAELETKLADFTGAGSAVACASGTDALLMALMAMGVRPGDGVVTTPFTFIATAEVIRLIGAVPLFADIDPVTFNLDPGCLERVIRRACGDRRASAPMPQPEVRRLRGIIAVDLFGTPAPYEKITPLAEAHGLFLIEDAAQSYGARRDGRGTGSHGDMAATSFFPAKPLGCYGDGGAVLTNSLKLADRLRSIRIHGQGGHKYENIRIGINGRLDTLQAAVLLAKLGIFEEEIALRQKAAERYGILMGDLPDLTLPTVPSRCRSVWAQYSILARDGACRSRICSALREAGVPTAVYYPTPLHLQPAFADLGYAAGDFPASEAAAGRIFSIPMHPYLKPEEQERIAAVIRGNV